MDYHLDRFLRAQEFGYKSALMELKHGYKIGHWMWFVFPQLRGLGQSSHAQYFGISGEDEARAYLAHPVLGSRLVEACEVLMRLENKDAGSIFGFPDLLKLRSCVTMFAALSEENSIFQQVLDAYYDGMADQTTLERLKSPDLSSKEIEDNR